MLYRTRGYSVDWGVGQIAGRGSADTPVCERIHCGRQECLPYPLQFVLHPLIGVAGQGEGVSCRMRGFYKEM